jgi:hypothetical protein
VVGAGLCLLLTGCGGTSKAQTGVTPPCGVGCGGSRNGSGGSGNTAGKPGSAGAPQQPLCEPGTTGCSGTRVMACNDAGTSFENTDTDCAQQSQVCLQGECVEPGCKAGTLTCVANSVYACSTSLFEQQLRETCFGGHCEQLSDTVAVCTPNTCVPEQPTCDGNVLKTCTADGTLPKKGKDCGDDVCEAGVCKPKVCEPFANLCVDGDVHQCPGLGTQTTPLKHCEDGQTCAPFGDSVACRARPCSTGATDCVGNVSGTCALDGMSLSGATQDCATTQQVCDASAACSASAIDTAGKAEDVEGITGGNLVGNIIDVHSARRVTKLEANLLLEAPRDLRWMIYEWTGTSFESKVNEITPNNNGSAFFASGPLDFELEVGKRYFLGVGLVVGEGYVYYDGPPWSPSLSFGGALGGATGGYAASYIFEPMINLYQLRVTSELP